MSVRDKRRSDSVEELSDGQLRCHLHNRHAFVDDPDIFLRTIAPNAQIWELIYDCNLCAVRRIDSCEPETYILLSREYDYSNANSYRISFPATKEDFRGEVIRRNRVKVTKRLA